MAIVILVDTFSVNLIFLQWNFGLNQCVFQMTTFLNITIIQIEPLVLKSVS